MDNEKCSKEHVTCAFYNTKNSMHCASCRHRVLFLSEQLLVEQAKNKKLVENINSIVKYCAKTDTIEWFDYDNIEAIADEVNNAK